MLRCLTVFVLTILICVPVARAKPPAPVDVLSVISTATTLEIGHADFQDGLRTTLFKLDRTTGSWRRIRRGTPYDRETRTYADSDVILGREYCYRIVARNADNENTTGEAACGVFNAGETAVRPPAAAADAAISELAQHRLVFSFTDGADNESGFEVQRRNGPVPTWESIASFPAADGTGTTISFADDSVDMNANYCYRVRSVNPHGSSLSDAACALTSPLAVTTPKGSGCILGPTAFAIAPQRTRISTVPLTLTVLWTDCQGQKEWTAWLYHADDLDVPLASINVADDRPRTLDSFMTATFRPLAASALYCVRVARRNVDPATRPILCESSQRLRRFSGDVGPKAGNMPRVVRVDPVPEGLQVTISDPREGQMLDIISDEGRRFSHLGAQTGSGVTLVPDLSEFHEYCVRAWVYNAFGSRYGPSLCAQPLPPAPVTYSTLLVPVIPNEGTVFWTHQVEPGPPRPVRLLRVRVSGNEFTPYRLRFIKPVPGPAVCTLAEGDGVTIVPGETLEGSDLATLFGSATPDIPPAGLALIACKLLQPGDSGVNPILIDVTFQRQ